MIKPIRNFRTWLAELISPPPIKLNLPTPASSAIHNKAVYQLGKVNPMSFSGVDTRIYVSEEPFTLKNKGTVLSAAQAISWVTDNHGNAIGSLIRLLLGNAEPLNEQLVGNYLTVLNTNRYGDYAVLASFKIEGIPKTSSGISIDDIVIEEHIMWRGRECSAALKIHGTFGVGPPE